MREVAIVAAGMTRFGEIWRSSLRDLFAEAASDAIKKAGADHVDSIYVGNMAAGQFVGQEHLGPMMAEQIGMAGVPCTRIESACASGGLALHVEPGLREPQGLPTFLGEPSAGGVPPVATAEIE